VIAYVVCWVAIPEERPDELFWPVAVVAVGVAVMLVGLRR
jgi:hypothetical protein